MSTTSVNDRISRLSTDPNLSSEDKIAGLMQIYLDARALQRAANEGGMIAEGEPTSADDVAAASEALRSYGVDATELERADPANL